MNKPTSKFDQHDAAWQEFCYQNARDFDLNTRDLAALCGVPLNTFVQLKPVTAVIAAGRAEFKRRAQQEFMGYLLADPSSIEDPAERAQMRSLQMDALKTWMKLETKREEMASLTEERDKDRETIKNLTTEELKAKAKELLK